MILARNLFLRRCRSCRCAVVDVALLSVTVRARVRGPASLATAAATAPSQRSAARPASARRGVSRGRMRWAVELRRFQLQCSDGSLRRGRPSSVLYLVLRSLLRTQMAQRVRQANAEVCWLSPRSPGGCGAPSFTEGTGLWPHRQRAGAGLWRPKLGSPFWRSTQGPSAVSSRRRLGRVPAWSAKFGGRHIGPASHYWCIQNSSALKA